MIRVLSFRSTTLKRPSEGGCRELLTASGRRNTWDEEFNFLNMNGFFEPCRVPDTSFIF